MLRPVIINEPNQFTVRGRTIRPASFSVTAYEPGGTGDRSLTERLQQQQRCRSMLLWLRVMGDALIGAKQRVMVRAGRLAFTLVASRRRARRRTHTPAGLDGTCEVAAAYRSMPAQALLPATDKERFLAGYGTASPRPPLPNPSKRARAARGQGLRGPGIQRPG